MMSVSKKMVIYFTMIIVIVVIDQVSKIYVHNHFALGESVKVIDGLFNLTYVRNSGAAFGFGQQFDNWLRYSLFLALPVVACIVLFVLLFKSFKEKRHLMAIIYTLILGGAIGNLIDRFRLGSVIDFFDFYIERSHFATFNVADSAISLAAMLLIYDYIQEILNKKNKVEA